jgi:predicted nucleic acid-binding protein
MKTLIFDAGPIISLATNNLLWILKPLKEKFNGNFYITGSVKNELVDRPLETKKFKFEAIQVQKLIEDGVLEVFESQKINKETPRLLEIANGIFQPYGHYMKIVHYAEVSVIIAALELNSGAIVIDEKTTRLLMENPKKVIEILRKTLHTSIKVNETNLKEFRNKVKGIKAIRSVELVTVAYEMGILDKFITNIPNPRKNLLESVLWGVKLNGCAVSKEEIAQIMKIEKK